MSRCTKWKALVIQIRHSSKQGPDVATGKVRAGLKGLSRVREALEAVTG